MYILIKRQKPLDSCHTDSPDSIDASNNGRSAGVSFAIVVTISDFLVLFVLEKQRQPV